jgi:precorrin-2/cobalt-factor-2 C20-methyltransferase
MSHGKLSLVGVGPGDPELVTRKAERVLREADIVYHPGRTNETGYALAIAREMITPGTAIHAAAVEIAEPGDRHETLAAELAAEARAGRRVAFITEGDPLVYSTASRLLAILQLRWPETPIEVIPGVTSLTAVAAAAGECLVQADESLLVVPACHHMAQLERLIETHDRVALVKIGSVFNQIVDLLSRRGWIGRAVFVERVGTCSERLVRELTSIDPNTVSYFSMILVRSR